jgi:uncharacterized membrane protein YfcA
LILDYAWLLLIAFAVGALIGAVGVGGILLIPALAAFGRLGMHEAMATALFTFAFTGIVGTILFQRKGSIDWRITWPVCAGAVVFAFVGAWLNSRTRPQTLTILLAAIIIFAGVYTLAAWRGRGSAALDDHARAQQMLLVGIGAVAGFGSGLTGVGGPALSVPIMVLFGFPALASIGASQVIQIIAAASGTLANLQFGAIDFALALPVTGSEVAGVFAGAALAHSMNQLVLRRFVGILCIPVGIFLIAHALA